MVGAVIMPVRPRGDGWCIHYVRAHVCERGALQHNIYLHSALVQSRAVDRKSKHAVDEAVYYFSIGAVRVCGVRACGAR